MNGILKKVAALIMAALIAVGFAPLLPADQVFADGETTITTVNVTVKAPVCGSEIISDEGTYDQLNYPVFYVSNNTGWVDETYSLWVDSIVKSFDDDPSPVTTKVTGGKKYNAFLAISLKSGYQFPANASSITVTVNGVKAESVLVDGDASGGINKYIYIGSTITADHNWNAGTVTKKATELAAGQKTFTCTACDATKTQTVAALAPTLKAVKIVKPKAGKKSATVKWKKISKKNLKKIKKVQIQYSLDKKFKKGVKTTTASAKKTSKKIKGLKKGKKYYVRVRALTGKHVSKWSAVKAVKAK